MSVGAGQREVLGKDIREFDHVQWPDNGRVETVVDPNWLIDGKPRVVRRIGWRSCMCCKRRTFSPDISRIRICNFCKDIRIDLSYDRMRERVPAKRPRRPRAATTISAIEPSGGIGVSHPAFTRTAPVSASANDVLTFSTDVT